MEEFDPIRCKHRWQLQTASQSNAGHGGMGHDYTIYGCPKCGAITIRGRIGNSGIDITHMGTNQEIATAALKTANWFNN